MLWIGRPRFAEREWSSTRTAATHENDAAESACCDRPSAQKLIILQLLLFLDLHVVAMDQREESSSSSSSSWNIFSALITWHHTISAVMIVNNGGSFEMAASFINTRWTVSASDCWWIIYDGETRGTVPGISSASVLASVCRPVRCANNAVYRLLTRS